MKQAGGLGGRRIGPMWPVIASLVGLFAGLACADDLDVVLATKAHNRDRLQRFSAEFEVETQQPATVPNPKATHLHFKMNLEKLPPAARAHSHNPWLITTEVTTPLAMKMKVEGDQASFLDHNGNWVAMKLTPELQQQFSGMSEQFMGADPAEQKKHFAIRVMRKNNPIFGPKTTTLEFIPKGQAKLFARMEEDDDEDGLPLATRLFDDKGKQTVAISVTKHHKVKTFPVVDEMVSDSDTPAGKIKTHTTCVNVQVETQ